MIYVKAPECRTSGGETLDLLYKMERYDENTKVGDVVLVDFSISSRNIRNVLSEVGLRIDKDYIHGKYVCLKQVRGLTLSFLKEIMTAPDKDLEELVDCALYSPEKMSARYKVFQIPKKSGGRRTIEAPDEFLKFVQRRLLHEFWYAGGGLRQCVQGFVPGRGTKTNAERHFDPQLARRQILLKSDLSDFFPSISAPMLFDRMIAMIDRRGRTGGYFKVPPKLVAALKGNQDLLPDCAEAIGRLPDDGKMVTCPESRTGTPEQLTDLRTVAGAYILLSWGVISLCTMDCRLPQGSPCSPAITNIYMDGFHTSALTCAQRISNELGDNITYSIYADDMCSTGQSVQGVLKMKGALSRITERYPDITLNEAKTGIFKCGQSQKVTGVSITDRVSISRCTRDKVRAELHNALVGKVELTDRDRMRLKGMRAHIIGIDPDGWNRRCADLYKRVIGE